MTRIRARDHRAHRRGSRGGIPDTVEVFADLGCPFTHVGLRRLLARRAELARDEPVLLVRAWPLELVNGQPLAPAVAPLGVLTRGDAAIVVGIAAVALALPTVARGARRVILR